MTNVLTLIEGGLYFVGVAVFVYIVLATVIMLIREG